MGTMLCRPSNARTLAVLLLGVCTVAAAAGPPRPATETEIIERLEAVGDAKPYKKASVVYVLDEADVYVESSGLALTESCQVIKLLTDAGVKSHSVLRNSYDPDTNRIDLKSVRVHRGDGTIDDLDLGEIISQPTEQSMIYWGGEQQLLVVPHLSVGDALEIRLHKIGFNIAYLNDGPGGSAASGRSAAIAAASADLQPPMPGHWYEVTPFQGGHPIVYKRYSVHMPAEMPLQYEVYNGAIRSSLWVEDGRRVYTFTAEDISASKREPHMVATSDCLPKVVMATVPDWEMKSRWFHEVNEPQFEADDAIRRKVAELTDHLNDQEEKIRALHHWVSDNIRYYGTSRGPCEGFTLHTGIETFRDKGGVCKDIAGMLVTMLRVLDLEVYPALTMAGSRVEALPADQFNHTVTVMRNDDGTFRVLDPTWSPVSREIWSSREALQGLVYGTPEGQSLTLSPYFAPEQNMLHARCTSTLSETGVLSADVRMDLTGYPCTYLRRNVNRDRRPSQRGRFERNLNIAPNAKITRLAHIEPRDYSSDGWVEFALSAEDYVAGDGDVRQFQLPMMRHPLSAIFIPDLLYDFSADERQFAMRLRASRQVRYEETIRIPPGWRVVHMPAAAAIESDTASLSFEISSDEGELTYQFDFVARDHQVAPGDYPDFKKAIEKMREIGNAWILLERADAEVASTVRHD